MKTILLLLSAGLAVFCLPGHSTAGCNHAAVRHYGYVKQAVVAYQPVYYQVGSALREEAIAQRAAAIAAERATKEADARWQKYVQERENKLLQFRGKATVDFQGEATASGEGTATFPDGDNGNAGGSALPSDVAKTFVDAKCIQCHGPNPRGNNLDLTGPLDFHTAKEAKSRMMSNVPGYRMPPDGPQPNDEQIGVIYKFSETLTPEPKGK